VYVCVNVRVFVRVRVCVCVSVWGGQTSAGSSLLWQIWQKNSCRGPRSLESPRRWIKGEEPRNKPDALGERGSRRGLVTDVPRGRDGEGVACRGLVGVRSPSGRRVSRRPPLVGVRSLSLAASARYAASASVSSALTAAARASTSRAVCSCCSCQTWCACFALTSVILAGIYINMRKR
jgi:hypothetical protein